MYRKLVAIFAIAILVYPLFVVRAQQNEPVGPVYIVQVGDTLSSIAGRFGLSLDDLVNANQITDPNQISEGSELVIPGLEGVDGYLTTIDVPYGENLRSISLRYGIPISMLAKLNHLVSPGELYAGYSLIIPLDEGTPTTQKRSLLGVGQSLLELAVENGASPWKLIQTNGYSGMWSALAGDILALPGEGTGGPGGLPGEITTVAIDPLPLLQGKTGLIRVVGDEGLKLSGSFMGHELSFFQTEPGHYVALQGVHAMTEPDLYGLTIEGDTSTGKSFAFTQKVQVSAVNYPFDRPLNVDPETTDPAVTGPENEQWLGLAGPVTSNRLWSGIFMFPSPLPADYCIETNECWSSRFGNRRSYNGSPYDYFHTGLDIVGKVGREIYAPAPGRVVFAGPMTVRGNATMIDHGWGVYTAYMHQSEILVQAGDLVDTGQVIGLVGATGRVEGPHLHWEVWVGGVQVDPLEWLLVEYP